MSFIFSSSSSSTSIKDSKAESLKPDDAKIPSSIKVLLRTGKSGKAQLKPLKVWLWYPVTGTSGTTTAIAPVISVTPGASAEFSALAAIYDEFKCDAVDLRFRVVPTAGSASQEWAMMYDPADSGVYSSVSAVLSANQKFGPVSSAPGTFSAPLNVNETGFYHMKAKMPSGAFSNNMATNLMTGLWCSTSTASVANVAWGYLKGYVTASSSGTTTYYGYVGCLTTFRVRV